MTAKILDQWFLPSILRFCSDSADSRWHVGFAQRVPGDAISHQTHMPAAASCGSPLRHSPFRRWLGRGPCARLASFRSMSSMLVDLSPPFTRSQMRGLPSQPAHDLQYHDKLL